jgi:dihydroorotate dehydrogenase
MKPTSLARYDSAQSYDWNYVNAPEPVAVEVPPLPAPRGGGSWQFCGLPVGSPLGVPAGPLLNGKWVRYYAALGFDVLTYKTVRSRERACYPMPNLVPVEVGAMTGHERQVPAVGRMHGTWAVSFGMPSKAPEVWRADVEATRGSLARDKVLVVSVVASEQPGWKLDDLANDYALCARWAVESGADAVETNFSCPNVCSSDGQLYQHPGDAALCAARVRKAIGNRPLIVKIGHLRGAEEAEALVEALAPHVDALAMTNSVAATVVGGDGKELFDGQPRGICGAAILDASVAQTKLVSQIVVKRHLSGGGKSLRLIGVGGAFSADDVRRYLIAGAESVHLATAVMVDPTVALRIRSTW